MRLDKFFSSLGLLSRKDCKIAIKKKQITVNNIVATTSDCKIDTNSDIVMLNDNVINYNQFTYVMVNKPLGVVSATTDKNQQTVVDLLPENYRKLQLFPCGRLDKDTVGLVILTNDGANAHRLLSPKHHAEKKYYYECAEPLLDCHIQNISAGINLADGYTTKPCTIQSIDNNSGYITLIEGKYHQIKRMFGACGNKITKLQRVSFAGILLDPNLQQGDWRHLNEQELLLFTK